MANEQMPTNQMNGAESLVRTLVASGVEVCFSNPGTSEMHFVAALDRVEGMRAILGLFEGAVTGMADGYGRIKETPAATLLHLGPGLANGSANLHNARRAGTPVVNIVGDHATYHAQYDAPLASDIAGFARPVSAWVHSSPSALHRCRRWRTRRRGGARTAGTDRNADPSRRHGLESRRTSRRAIACAATRASRIERHRRHLPWRFNRASARPFSFAVML